MFLCRMIAAATLASCFAVPVQEQDKQDTPKKDEAPESPGAPPPKKDVSKAEAIKIAVQELLKMQEETGRWSYEAYHQDAGEPLGLPYGFQVGGTSIVGEALLLTAPEDKAILAAVHRGLAFVLKALEHDKMSALTKAAYDVRIWGHGFALQFLCRLRALDKAGVHAKAVKEWIPRLVETITQEEHKGGGWNYGGAGSASFVTSPVIQSLLLARSQGEKVDDELLDRALKAIQSHRMEDGAFVYAGKSSSPQVQQLKGSSLGGSATRGLVCEATLSMMGATTPEAIAFSLKNFYEHWDDLEVRRAKSGTHVGKYNIAPYYFYYGHRFAAQVIELLPESRRAAERERLVRTILKTRDEDGTWNDRFQPLHKRSRNVGTAFVLLAFLAERAPAPPNLKK